MIRITNQKVSLRTLIDLLNSNMKVAQDTCNQHINDYGTSEKSRKAYKIASERYDALFQLDHNIRKTFLTDEEY